MQKMKMFRKLLLKGAEGVAAAMLAAMFITFVLQIFSRYVLNEPFGWTLEVCLTLWLWLVFWGNAFVVRHDEHVIFDMIFNAVKPGTRRVLALIGSASIVIGLAVSLPPTWDFIDFLKIKKSAILQIPMRTVFSIYLIFLVSAIVVYGCRFVWVLRYGITKEKPMEIRESFTEDLS